ncbi:adaptor protein MecA [Desertibacillus haloalkaliphilus]|uniref:adaptor protein MecA n=1 Tax=Desertibacillus haloalkaliphilus TaxID=1328930 RepID=UPI001C259231|nr:adaptor protein MecA [Desertibacillus haloalkaliphilus]MBU8906913.1 adaptor protein MecA [Desertibacillus haloalkaliphilus]
MEIERVNETTLKFYITYKDIEERGFDRNEIWYNRERGEELFFEMMSEATDQDENFEIEGPLWIQVQALDKGLEIIVTRGQISDGNVKLEIPFGNEKETDLPVDQNIVDMLDEQFSHSKSKSAHTKEDERLELVIGFEDFEHLISLSHSFTSRDFVNKLYHFEGKYYLYVVFEDDYTEDEQDNMLSQILEFGQESDITIYRIEEYGKSIIAENALDVLRENFAEM